MSSLKMLWRRNRIFMWSFMVLTFDWVTKQIAVETLPYAEPQVVYPWLNWTLVYNSGAAFSFLASHAGWQRWFLSAVALIAIVFFYKWANRLQSTEKWQRFAIALIIGGALGNVIDRLRFAYVVDFIDVHVGAYHWPAFNIADSAICLGIMIILLSLWTSKTPKSS